MAMVMILNTLSCTIYSGDEITDKSHSTRSIVGTRNYIIDGRSDSTELKIEIRYSVSPCWYSIFSALPHTRFIDSIVFSQYRHRNWF